MGLSGEGDGGLRMGIQTMCRRRPLSRFMFGVAFPIWIDSTVVLSQNPSALSLDCCTFPVDAMVGLLDMNYNTVFGVSSSHHLSMFTQSDFQCPVEGNRAWGGGFVMYAWSTITSVPNTSMQWMERIPICTIPNWVHFGTLLELFWGIQGWWGPHPCTKLKHVCSLHPNFSISWFLLTPCTTACIHTCCPCYNHVMIVNSSDYKH